MCKQLGQYILLLSLFEDFKHGIDELKGAYCLACKFLKRPFLHLELLRNLQNELLHVLLIGEIYPR